MSILEHRVLLMRCQRVQPREILVRATSWCTSCRSDRSWRRPSPHSTSPGSISHFRVEERDRVALTDCESAIVTPGGQIFFALRADVVIGTCAVIQVDPATCELAKMAVTPAAQGQGVGRRLGETAIAFARQAGARKIMLLTNSRLAPALRLYEQLGFERGPLPARTESARVSKG